MSNGQRPARTAQDVAQLEADNEYLHNENERLTRELAIVTSDRSRLQVENALLEGKGRDALLKLTRMETIIRVHSSGLVASLQEIAQERVTERAVRRQVQEDQITGETGPAPTFLSRGTDRTRPREEVVGAVEATGGQQYDQVAAPARAPVQPEARRESDQDREDRLRGAAERIRPMPPPFRPARIDPALADRDARLPPHVDYGDQRPVIHPTLQEQDDDNLRRLAGDMDGGTRAR